MSGQLHLMDPARRFDEDEPRGRLLAGLPVTERRLRLAGASTTLLEGGEGPPMVLLHGGTDSGGVSWAPLITRLSRSARIVVPDLPGLGESEPVAEMNEVIFSDWLAEVVRMTCEEKPTLVAHSLLGSLAARFAIHHGEMLQRLVLIGVPAVGPYHMPLGLVIAAIRFDLRASERSGAGFADWAFLDPVRTRDRDPEWFDAFMAYEVSRGTIPHVRRTMRQLIKACTGQIPDADTRRLVVPTALIWGREDRMVRLRIAELASTKFGWPLQVIEDAGHVPMVEQPESFMRELRVALAYRKP
jgi:pimeloyl-ACP methyl ester carboxylesterase